MGAIDVRIRSGDCVTFAKVSPQGALAVSAVAFDDTAVNSMAVANQAFNFYSPRPHFNFVITGILVFANKDVGDASSTVIEIYEATSTTDTVVARALLTFGMGKLTSLPIVPLNLLVNEGFFVNAKADDAIIVMTIMGYFAKTTVV